MDFLGVDVCIDVVGGEVNGNVMQLFLGKKLMLQGGVVIIFYWVINVVKKGGVVFVVGVYGFVDCLIFIGNVVNKGIIICVNQVFVKRLLFGFLEYV